MENARKKNMQIGFLLSKIFLKEINFWLMQGLERMQVESEAICALMILSKI